MARRAQMFPLNFEHPLTAWYVEQIVLAGAREVGLLALRHALTHQLPGVWGDNPLVPRSLVLVREGDGQLEAFGMGRPSPAVLWLAGLGLPVTLAAPADWRKAVAARVEAVEVGTVETWVQTGAPPPRDGDIPIAARRLTLDDAPAFAAAAPAWALRGWITFEALIAYGAAFGVPHDGGFASLAWVFDQSAYYAAVGVSTVPRFRWLGLARAVVAVLLRYLRHERNMVPLWSTTPDNAASQALARSLGFVPEVRETVIRWPPRSAISEPARAPTVGGNRSGGARPCSP